ncbi:MAG: DUF362 domain-containing protein [Candidatus Odinarchaeia archaeon]
MNSEVYFADFREDPYRNWTDVVKKIYEKTAANVVDNGDIVAVKLHMGERVSGGVVKPGWVRLFIDEIKKSRGRPFITDTVTLYRRSRRDALEYLETAALNGFTMSTMGCPIIIADGLHGNDFQLFPTGGKLKEIPVASAIAEADAMIVLSHGKGHRLCGFGGAVKNLGMGAVSKEAKILVHSAAKPIVDENKCIGCGVCIEHCRWNAISIVSGNAVIDHNKCVGCIDCMINCPTGAISQPKDQIEEVFSRLVEAAAAVKNSFQPGKIAYFTFLTDITALCDCAPHVGPKVVPDIGVLGSKDMVAIDKAALDLINNSPSLLDNVYGNKFEMLHDVDPYLLFRFTQKLGLGDGSYQLIKI